ncbi:hypothetical protein CR513_47423, partial [Mucuna pruriens]
MAILGSTTPSHRRGKQLQIGSHRPMLGPECGSPNRLQDSGVRQIQRELLPSSSLSYVLPKMVKYIYDDKVLIHYFQDSLIGAALRRLQGVCQRWRELVAQVQPPITEREMVTMFIDTLPSPYYDRVVGNVASTFADVVVVGKRIELGILQGKFA